ncbi:MAG TPA: HD domain-containing protein [Desertimonas sp.]|nr:HD domain-containing protein [Desertimonas sp.]
MIAPVATDPSAAPERAAFKAMTEGTQEDWNHIITSAFEFYPQLADRVITHLRLLDGDFGGFRVDRLTHSLQTATRAYRANRGDDYIACALIHDIGDTLGSFNHADIGAAIVKPFVSDELHWMVEKHAIFQGYYFFHFLGLDRDMRDQFADHPYYDITAEFTAEFDQPAFDPDYPTMTLDEFTPLLRQFFSAPQRSIYLREDSSA